MKNVGLAALFLLPCFLLPPLAAGDEKDPRAVAVAWETDYLHALDVANQQQKMLFIAFQDDNDPQSRKLGKETLENAEVQQKLLGEAGVTLSVPQVWKLLRKLGLRLKKSRSTPASEIPKPTAKSVRSLSLELRRSRRNA